MGMKKGTPQVTARCVFCNRPGVNHQHIWPKWARKIIGNSSSRTESVMMGGTLENPVYERRFREGGIETKSARKVCPACNSGWMRDIELAAEAVGAKLLTGKPVDLRKDDQVAIASFIVQSALMIDLVGKKNVKFPKSAFEYFYTNKIPPPDWYVAIGCYGAPLGLNVEVDYSPQRATGGGTIVTHSISTTLGHLFTSVQAVTATRESGEPSPPGPFSQWSISINAPHLTPICPYLTEVIRFPPAPPLIIGGRLIVDGGLARDLAIRFPRAVMDFIMRTHPGGMAPT
jgi:hypothetical protein